MFSKSGEWGPPIYCFVLTVFVSAFLLFVVQPMLGEMILPKLGGSSSVWTTTMLFFQVMLLLGYSYAHGLTRAVPVQYQVYLHALLMLGASLLLPISVSYRYLTFIDHTASSVFLSLLLGAGWPVFVVSSTAPLFQHWYGQTDLKDSDDPYFLYAASNTGSMLALISYPFLIDRTFNLQNQSLFWSYGFILLAIFALCSVYLLLNRKPVQDSGTTDNTIVSVSWFRRFRWIVYTFIPSSLMLGVTHYITTDLASVPLLWILPLAAYLFSFILVFSDVSIPLRFYRVVLPGIIVMTFAVSYGDTLAFYAQLPLHLLTFFLIALYFHGELAEDRPETVHLTRFYVYVALGGSLGGVFNAIVAPIVFDTLIEYYLVTAVALALVGIENQTFLKVSSYIIGMGAVFYLFIVIKTPNIFALPILQIVLLTVGFTLTLTLIIRQPTILNVIIAVAFFVGYWMHTDQIDYLAQERSFYGYYKVRETEGIGRTLLSGTTQHGYQKIKDGKLLYEAKSYYHPAGPVGDIAAHFDYDRVGIGGLGVGGLAPYANVGDKFTFFEIDPTVRKLAYRYFSYLDKCGQRCEIKIGDARQLIEKYQYNFFDLLIMDAYSSDSIPTHLLTKQAVKTYVSRVSEDGIVVFHISNRYLQLEPILGRIAKELNLVAYTKDYVPPLELIHASGSKYVVISREKSDIKQLAKKPEWRPTFVGEVLWTDSYANIVTAFLNKNDLAIPTFEDMLNWFSPELRERS